MYIVQSAWSIRIRIMILVDQSLSVVTKGEVANKTFVERIYIKAELQSAKSTWIGLSPLDKWTRQNKAIIRHTRI